jgi:hypothetical protein
MITRRNTIVLPQLGGVAEWSKAAVLKVDAKSADAGAGAVLAIDPEKAAPVIAAAKPAIAGVETVLDSSDLDPVDVALSKALLVAAEQGDLSAITQITVELRERRQARAGVPVLGDERAKRGYR